MIEFRIQDEDFSIVKEILAIEMVTNLNLNWLNKNGPICLSCENIEFKPPSKNYRSNIIPIATIPIILDRGHAKCDEIVAAYWAIEIYFGNKNLYPHIIHQGNDYYHAMLIDNTRQVIDPSKLLENKICQYQ